jgi:hypothetical protein
MIAAILSKLAPWLKWLPLVAVIFAYQYGSQQGDLRCRADKAEGLENQLTGIQDELKRTNDIALSSETRRAEIETRNRELQRSVTHEATKTLDAVPVPPDVLSAIAAGRVRPAAGEPAR